MSRRVVSGLMFFPRGGSSHVARSLAHQLPSHGWDVTILSGSCHGGHGDAERFYRGLDVCTVDFDRPGVPMHPSYEDRPDAPDPVFGRVDDEEYERHVEVWSQALRRARAATADVLHLHHLTPLHEAALRVAPDVPVVGHLHGTELLMLEEIEAGTDWPYADAWVKRLRRWAQRCVQLVVLSETQIERAEQLLDIDPSKCVVLPNGFDPERFHHLDVDRAVHWKHHLVDDPQGTDAAGRTLAYDDVTALVEGTVLLSVSRFTAVKRLPLLIEAFATARSALKKRAALVIVGGHPGEWEGEHPAATIERLGVPDVFLAGWHDHDELPAFLGASDVLALASVREQFGQVLVEAMACGIPPIAVDRYGPSEIVRPGRTGWLVEPDDRADLCRAIRAAVDDRDDRRARGAAARRDAQTRFSWPALAGRLATVLDDVAAATGARA